MVEEPAAAPLDAIDLQSLSDEELKRLTQLLMGERERRMGLELAPKTLSSSNAVSTRVPRPSKCRAVVHVASVSGCRSPS